MSWVAYILQCADGTFYTGATNDLDKRVKAHNLGKGAKYTRSRRPVKLVYIYPCVNRSTAQAAEAWIKRQKRSKKYELVESYHERS